jgi:hypothetical protein
LTIKHKYSKLDYGANYYSPVHFDKLKKGQPELAADRHLYIRQDATLEQVPVVRSFDPYRTPVLSA